MTKDFGAFLVEDVGIEEITNVFSKSYVLMEKGDSPTLTFAVVLNGTKTLYGELLLHKDDLDLARKINAIPREEKPLLRLDLRIRRDSSYEVSNGLEWGRIYPFEGRLALDKEEG